MYESFYGLKEKPFTLLPDPEYLYMSPKHQRALTLLEYGMMNQAGFSVICGDTGAGKTTLIRRLLTELGDDTTVGLITNTHQSFGDLLDWVLMAFGLDSEDQSKFKKHQMFVEFLIEQYAQNKRTVLIVDEAQNIKADMLEELRMLSNINADKDQVLQVILAGQPALRDTLRKPELMQFAQRIAVDYYLESLSREETTVYIHHRLKVAGADKPIFTDEACDAIYRYSGGTPRLINLLCDTTLVYGFAEQTETITKKLVDDVVREQHGNSIVPTFNNPLVENKVERQEKVTSELIEEELIAEELENKITENSESEVKEQSNAAIAEHGKRAGNAASNFNSVVSTGTTQVDGNASASSKILSNSEISGKSVDSNITPINQDTAIEEDKAEKEVRLKAEEKKETIAEQERKLAEEELDNDESLKEDTKDAVESSGFKKDFIEDKDTNVDNKKEIEEELVFEHVEDEEQDKTQGNRTTQQPVEDVYPIIHVEDSTKKNINILVLGFAGGMLLAAILIMIMAYVMFGNNMQAVPEQVQSPENITAPLSTETEIVRQAEIKQQERQRQQELGKARLQAIEKERDAAMAITKALERERDAALLAAKAQQEMRFAEKRAVEIIAQQERKAAREVKKAQQRVREAELAAAKANERERVMKIQVMKAKLAAQKKKDALAVQVNSSPVVTHLAPKDIKPVKKQAKPKGLTKFSANPCSSPSAKFLSTCKK